LYQIPQRNGIKVVLHITSKSYIGKKKKTVIGGEIAFARIVGYTLED